MSLAYYIPTQANHTTWDPGFAEWPIVLPILLWRFPLAVQLLRQPGGPSPAAVSARPLL